MEVAPHTESDYWSRRERAIRAREKRRRRALLFKFTFGSAVCLACATVVYYALRPLPFWTRENLLLLACPAVVVFSVATGLLSRKSRWIAYAILCAMMTVGSLYSGEVGPLAHGMTGAFLCLSAGLGAAITFIVGRFRDWKWPTGRRNGAPWPGSGARDKHDTA